VSSNDLIFIQKSKLLSNFSPILTHNPIILVTAINHGFDQGKPNFINPSWLLVLKETESYDLIVYYTGCHKYVPFAPSF